MTGHQSILLVGGDGSIGSRLAAEFQARGHRVTLTTRRRAAVEDAVAGRYVVPGPKKYLDMTKLQDLSSLGETHDCVVVAAALTGLKACRDRHLESRQINETAPVEIAKWASCFGARTVFLSTNHVFDGTTPAPTSSDPRSPRSLYGRQKASAEVGILGSSESAAVLRLTKVFGVASPLLRTWHGSLMAGNKIQAFSDASIAPVSIDAASDAIVSIVEKKARGVFHLSGNENIAYTEVAFALASALNVPTGLVDVTTVREVGIPVEEAPRYSSLGMGAAEYSIGLVPSNSRGVLRNTLDAILRDVNGSGTSL